MEGANTTYLNYFCPPLPFALPFYPLQVSHIPFCTSLNLHLFHHDQHRVAWPVNQPYARLTILSSSCSATITTSSNLASNQPPRQPSSSPPSHSLFPSS